MPFRCLLFLLPIVALATVLTTAPAQAEYPATDMTEQEDDTVGMTTWNAFVLGAVEGFTEYLPVSSTGHLILAQRAMGIGQTEREKVAADAYAIAIQAGAILAVLTLYFPYMRRMIRGVFGRDPGGLKLAINIGIAFLPAAVIGLLFHELIKAYLFNLWAIVFSWFVGGLVILLITRLKWDDPNRVGRLLEELTWKHALIIGFMQCIAMWPGTSRSLVTIIGGLLVGLNLTSAVIFSFLLGVVTLTAATVYDTVTHGTIMLNEFGFMNIFIGFTVATIAAIISVKWFLSYLKRHGLALFGYYRIALAVVVTILILRGVLIDQL